MAKFVCPVLENSLRAQIECQTGLKSGVIDRFLSEQYGKTWTGRPKLILGDVNQAPRRNLWEFALQSNVLLRRFKSDRSSGHGLGGLPGLRVDGKCFDFWGYAFWLPTSCVVISDDLATAWHPKFHGRHVFPDCTDSSAAWKSTCKALELITPYPDFKELVFGECGAVCFISANPRIDEGQCISLTSKTVPGMAYASSMPSILLTESLVHESVHLRFRAIEEVKDLYARGIDSRVATPLRTDLRSVSGLMHQLVVLRYLCSLYEMLVVSEDATIARQRPQVEKRFHVHTQDLDAGKRMARDVKNTLTLDGRELLDRLLEDSEPLLS